MKRFSVWILALSLLALGCRPTTFEAEKNPTAPKNIIFFIGDGMGPAHVTLARLAQKEGLVIDDFPVVGKSKTSCLDFAATDSAAAATSMATGWKTLRGAVGMAPEPGTKNLVPVQTIAEFLKSKGYEIGVVTSTYVTDATPACFISHAANRYQGQADIVRDFVDSGARVIMGGGKNNFSPATLQKFLDKDYQILNNREELKQAQPQKKLLGLFAPSKLKFQLDRNPKVQPSLQDMTIQALKSFEGSKKPFFLMVEGARIDHAGHIHDGPSVIRESRDFMQAIDYALSWSRLRNDTLIVVTGDHGTGGLAISRNFDKKPLLKSTMSSEEMARRVLEGGENPDVLLKKFGGIEPNKKLAAYKLLIKWQKEYQSSDAKTDWKLRRRLSWVTQKALGTLLSQPGGVFFYPLTYDGDYRPEHTAEDVTVYAYGPGSYLFSGVYENSDIPIRMARALGLKFTPKQLEKKKREGASK